MACESWIVLSSIQKSVRLERFIFQKPKLCKDI
jgi:hypothetical protein